MIQQLEPRRLLSLSVSVDAGVLIVQGDKRANVITVDQNATAVSVTLDDSTFSTPLRKVKSIRILGMEGNDVLTLTPNVTLPAGLFGGAGNDTLVGSDHPTTLSGDAGNDILRSGRGKDVVSGGAGTDTADYSARTEALIITLDGRANDGSKAGTGIVAENDNLANDIEIVKGGAGDDRITGNSLANTLDSCVCPPTGCVNQNGRSYFCHPTLPLSLNAVTNTGITPPNGTSHMPTVAGPVYAEFNTATDQLIVADYDGGTISVIDVSLDQYQNDSPTFGTTFTIPVGNRPAPVLNGCGHPFHAGNAS